MKRYNPFQDEDDDDDNDKDNEDSLVAPAIQVQLNSNASFSNPPTHPILTVGSDGTRRSLKQS